MQQSLKRAKWFDHFNDFRKNDNLDSYNIKVGDYRLLFDQFFSTKAYFGIWYSAEYASDVSNFFNSERYYF